MKCRASANKCGKSVCILFPRHIIVPNCRIRKQSLILNLPGPPKSIQKKQEGVTNDRVAIEVQVIFSSVPYCIQLPDGPYLKTELSVVTAF